jgi:polar amino acid transport system permease protein
MLAANFDWQFIWDHLPDFWEGLKATLKVSAIGIAGSLAIGCCSARPRAPPTGDQLAGRRLRRGGPEYTDSRPDLLHRVRVATIFRDIRSARAVHDRVAGVVVWGGAYNTENFRAAFEAVPYRYREAGLALASDGLRPSSTSPCRLVRGSRCRRRSTRTCRC